MTELTHTQARREQRMHALQATIARLGLHVEPVGTGTAVRIRGHGVDLFAASLAFVEPGDLRRAEHGTAPHFSASQPEQHNKKAPHGNQQKFA